MDITREQREKRYATAPAAVQALYDSDDSGTQMFAVFQKHDLPTEKYKPYALTIANVILGFYPLSQLSELLEHALDIPPAQAKQIVSDLQPFFAPIRDILASHPAEQALASGYPTVETTQRPPVVPTPAQYQQPAPTVAPPSQVPPPAPQPVAPPAPTTWQHVQETNPVAPQVAVMPPSAAPIPLNMPTQAPPTIPQYQKPLTNVPSYRNANLYQKPGGGQSPQPPNNLPT